MKKDKKVYHENCPSHSPILHHAYFSHTSTPITSVKFLVYLFRVPLWMQKLFWVFFNFFHAKGNTILIFLLYLIYLGNLSTLVLKEHPHFLPSFFPPFLPPFLFSFFKQYIVIRLMEYHNVFGGLLSCLFKAAILNALGNVGGKDTMRTRKSRKSPKSPAKKLWPGRQKLKKLWLCTALKHIWSARGLRSDCTCPSCRRKENTQFLWSFNTPECGCCRVSKWGQIGSWCMSCPKVNSCNKEIDSMIDRGEIRTFMHR